MAINTAQLASDAGTSGEVPNSRISFDDMEEVMGGLPETPSDFDKGTKDGDTIDDNGESEGLGKSDGVSDGSGEGDEDVGAGGKPAPVPGKDTQKPKEQEGKQGEGKPAEAGKGTKPGAALPKEPYRATVDGKVVDIAPGGVLKVKVAGKDEEVTVHDLVTNYTGKIAYDRKFQDLTIDRKAFDTERTTHHAERNKLVTTVKAAHQLAVEKNDPRGMVFLLAEQMNAKPMDVWKGVVSKVAETLKANGVVVDEAALENQFKDDEIAYHQGKEVRKTEETAATASRQALEGRMTKVQDRFKSGDAETTLGKKQVVEIYDRLLKSGKYEQDAITPELIGDVHETDQAFVLAEKVVADLKVPAENKEKVLDLVASAKLQNPEFSQAQLLQITREALGVEVEKAAKVLKAKTVQRDRKPGKRAESEDEGPFSFDDLDD